MFQSTLPRGERPVPGTVLRFVRVSIHAPAWGATLKEQAAKTLAGRFQSTLPRGERPDNLCVHHVCRMFQSTLPRGERQGNHASVVKRYGFNPRSRVGSDGVESPPASAKSCFNPRSRVGSDRPAAIQSVGHRCFNPRSRVGSDRSCLQGL